MNEDATVAQINLSDDKVGGFENLEVGFGGVVGFGAVDDGLGFGSPGDFLEGERGSEDVLGEPFAAGGVVGWHGAFAAVHIEAGMLPGEEIGELGRGDEFGVAEGVAEGVEEAAAVWKRRWRRLQKMPRSTRGMLKTD